MVGRAEHFRSQAKHAQRPIPTKKASPLDDSIWFSAGMQICRDLGMKGGFGVEEFVAQAECSEYEAERRLRVLTRAGFLYMAVVRNEDGSFLRYAWDIADPDLPVNR